MTKYIEKHGYINNLQEIDNHPGDAEMILYSLAQFSFKNDKPMHEFLQDMRDINMMKGDICPNIIDEFDVDILNYTGNVINGQPELIN